MRVLVDTNVLLDVALQRGEFLVDSDAVVQWCQDHPGQGFVAWHSIANIYFILEKNLGDSQARDFISTMLDIFEISMTGAPSAKHALRLSMRDYEDALQTVAAIAVGADAIVTRDAKHYKDSPVPAQSPSEFLQSQMP